jgi:hypothetical protein
MSIKPNASERLTVTTFDLLGLWLGLALANYIYIAIGTHEWMVAHERNSYQAVAFLLVWLRGKIKVWFNK